MIHEINVCLDVYYYNNADYFSLLKKFLELSRELKARFQIKQRIVKAKDQNANCIGLDF